MTDLSYKDAEAVATIQRRLLAQQSLADDREMHGLLTDIAGLLQCDRAAACISRENSVAMISHNLRPHVENWMTGNFRGHDGDGYLAMRDPEFDEFNRLRREMGSGVYHDRDMIDRRQLERSRFHREAFLPSGMNYSSGLCARLPVGEAAFVFGFDDPDHPGFASDRAMAILGLLHPIFCHAFEMVQARECQVSRLQLALEELPVAAALVADNGEVVAVNHSRMKDALPCPSGPERTLRLKGPVLEDGRLTTYWIAAEAEVSASLLKHRARTLGLTNRQAEIARLLADGASDKHIARELGISPHTVRTHVEKILKRLQIGSRAAVLGALLSGRLLS